MVCALIDGRIPNEAEARLRLEGIEPILLPACRSLPEAIASHPDTLVFKCGNDIYASAEYCDEAAYVFGDVRELAPHVRVHFTADILGKRYPDDCRFNARVMGNMLVCNRYTVSKSILEAARARGLKTVHTRQGYPACTTLYLGDTAAISSDRGVIKALAGVGVECLEIEKGGIALPPYEYGFIGGACGVFHDTVYFFGDLDTHPSSDIIRAFLDKRGYRAVSLFDGALVDLGGIVFLEKEADQHRYNGDHQ
jgi:hypothetical protein